jgi:hypothetical protein
MTVRRGFLKDGCAGNAFVSNALTGPFQSTALETTLNLMTFVRSWPPGPDRRSAPPPGVGVALFPKRQRPGALAGRRRPGPEVQSVSQQTGWVSLPPVRWPPSRPSDDPLLSPFSPTPPRLSALAVFPHIRRSGKSVLPRLERGRVIEVTAVRLTPARVRCLTRTGALAEGVLSPRTAAPPRRRSCPACCRSRSPSWRVRRCRRY